LFCPARGERASSATTSCYGRSSPLLQAALWVAELELSLPDAVPLEIF